MSLVETYPAVMQTIATAIAVPILVAVDEADLTSIGSGGIDHQSIFIFLSFLTLALAFDLFPVIGHVARGVTEPSAVTCFGHFLE